MNTHANVRLTQMGRLRLVSRHRNNHPLWHNCPQKQGFPCAVPRSGWPATARAGQPHWRVDGVLAAASGGRSILNTSSTPWNSAINGYTYITWPGCFWQPSQLGPGL